MNIHDALTHAIEHADEAVSDLYAPDGAPAVEAQISIAYAIIALVQAVDALRPRYSNTGPR